MNVIDIEPGWLALLHDCFGSHYMQKLRQYLQERKKQGAIIYPPTSMIFHAFWKTPLEEVKVIVLGQDPYHGADQAHGLSFSVADNIAPPPSLKNIHKEMLSDLGIDNHGKGNLEPWAKQGVLLLNSVLTVEADQAGSHRNQGWEEFTDQVIQRLAGFRSNLVFILWGAYAQKKGAFIDATEHHVISSAHPSPLSAYNGFWNSRPFSRTNEYLNHCNTSPIDWRL